MVEQTKTNKHKQKQTETPTESKLWSKRPSDDAEHNEICGTTNSSKPLEYDGENDVTHELGSKPPLLNRKRGGKKRSKEAKSLLLYFVNINGYATKKESLKNIIEVVKPDIIGLVETKFAKNKNIEMEGWEPFKRNCSKGKAGVMCALRKGTFKSAQCHLHRS